MAVDHRGPDDGRGLLRETGPRNCGRDGKYKSAHEAQGVVAFHGRLSDQGYQWHVADDPGAYPARGILAADVARMPHLRRQVKAAPVARYSDPGPANRETAAAQPVTTVTGVSSRSEMSTGLFTSTRRPSGDTANDEPAES